jgi:hypothetical protein
MSAFTIAQEATGGGADTAVVVAVISAVGVVLGALVSVFGLRLGARLDAIEKGQAALAATCERLERRMEDGLARLADRIDRLYGSPRELSVEEVAGMLRKAVQPPDDRHDEIEFDTGDEISESGAPRTAGSET